MNFYCIHIQLIHNSQGGHNLYNLSTHDIRQYVNVIPMTTTVIESVERLDEGMKSY